MRAHAACRAQADTGIFRSGETNRNRKWLREYGERICRFSEGDQWRIRPAAGDIRRERPARARCSRRNRASAQRYGRSAVDGGDLMAEHSLSAEPTHSRWNRALEPRLEIASGDTVRMECVDSSGAQVHPGMTSEDFLAIDRGRIHALTGPIFVKGAEPGDTLEVEIHEVQHKG